MSLSIIDTVLKSPSEYEDLIGLARGIVNKVVAANAENIVRHMDRNIDIRDECHRLREIMQAHQFETIVFGDDTSFYNLFINLLVRRLDRGNPS